jgi:hypothetical protein
VKISDEFLTKLSRTLADQGKLIEAGWISLRLAAIPRDATEIQINEMRMAYMAGAQHLFSSIMVVMDDDHEPTESDLRRMDLIHKELEAFGEELKLRIVASSGNA